MQEHSCDTDANPRILYGLRPHFAWQLSFVISRCQTAARVGSRQSVVMRIRWMSEQELAADSCQINWTWACLMLATWVGSGTAGYH